MGRYVLSRFAQAIPVLVLSSIVIFLVLYLAPGDPATSLAGTEATPAQVAQLRHHLGLDKPLWHQYLLWANRVLHGDFGHSYLNQLPTLSLIWGRVPASAELAGAALAITLLVGIPLGILTSLRPGGLIDRGMSATTAVMIAVPNFWLGIIGILLFVTATVVVAAIPFGNFLGLALTVGCDADNEGDRTVKRGHLGGPISLIGRRIQTLDKGFRVRVAGSEEVLHAQRP